MTVDEAKTLARAIEGGLLDDVLRRYLILRMNFSPFWDETNALLSGVLGREILIYGTAPGCPENSEIVHRAVGKRVQGWRSR